MTKSWHEDYQEGPRRVRQKKEGKEEMKGREGSVKKYKQPSSELRLVFPILNLRQIGQGVYELWSDLQKQGLHIR